MTDLISKQAAIEHLKKRLYETELNSDAPFPYYAEMADNRVSVWLNELPTIEPVKHGKWMPHPTEPDWDVCSVCGIGTMRRTHGYHNGAFWDAEENYSYCPHCGARMNE